MSINPQEESNNLGAYDKLRREDYITRKIWKYTCTNCPWIPRKKVIWTPGGDREYEWVMDDPEYVRTLRISKRTGEPGYFPTHFPDRCLECKRKYRRATRMAKRVDRIYWHAIKQGGIYKKPKLITFALPSKWWDQDNLEDYTTRESEIKKLNKLLPAARLQLQSSGTLGGTYVVECTYKWIPDLENFTHPKHKYHAHVHMVAISKWIHPTKLAEYSEQLRTIGLGRISYEAVRYRKQVSEYVSKYLVKDNQTSRTWGCMRTKAEHQDSKSEKHK